MQYTTSSVLFATVRAFPGRIHGLAVVCLVALVLLGHPLEVSAGWLAWPPAIYVSQNRRRRAAADRSTVRDAVAAWVYIGQTWRLPFMRGLLVQMLWLAGGHTGIAWGIVLPWLAWGWPLTGLLWPCLARQPEWRLVQHMLSHMMRSPLWLILALAAPGGAGAVPAVGRDHGGRCALHVLRFGRCGAQERDTARQAGD